jgi:hypothetical protein
MAVTVPEMLAWAGTETKPAASLTGSPARTLAPTSTTGREGAPICCCTGMMTCGGIGSFSTGLASVQRLFSAG